MYFTTGRLQCRFTAIMLLISNFHHKRALFMCKITHFTCCWYDMLHDSTDWSDKSDRNSGQWLFNSNKWLFKITHLPYSWYKEQPLQVNNEYRQTGQRNKSTVLIFSLQQTEKTFQIRPPESDILTFSSSLPQFSPEVILAPQFRTDSSTWLLRDFSVSAHFPPVTPFLPLDSKNKRKKKLSLSAPQVWIWSNHSWVWHWTLFQGFSSHLSYSLLFFPFLILPRSEDYVKQGMRVKGKFSG